MTFSVTLEPIAVSNNDIDTIKKSKIMLIDKLNYSGTRYVAIAYLSAILNETIDLFNKNEELIFVLRERDLAGEYDLNKLLTYFDVFMSILEEKNVAANVREHINSIVVQAFSTVDAKSKAYTAAMSTI